jgi:hypothetical protein
MAQDEECKTAFHMGYSLFEYNIMFFGFTNALVDFLAFINNILYLILDIFVMALLDDIFI